MLGMDAALPWRHVALAQTMKAKPSRQLFRAVQIDRQGQAQPLTWHGSGDLMHTAHADGWVRLPMQNDEVPAGEMTPYLPLQS